MYYVHVFPITKACEQATRAGDIIQRMRDFVEKRDTNKQRNDANAIVMESTALGLIGIKAAGIEPRYNLASDLPPVFVDRVQIEQVLVNLLHNAMDAMAETPERVLTLSSRQTGGAVEIIVGATGKGIPEAVVHSLFQPFVTKRANLPGAGGVWDWRKSTSARRSTDRGECDDVLLSSHRAFGGIA